MTAPTRSAAAGSTLISVPKVPASRRRSESSSSVYGMTGRRSASPAQARTTVGVTCPIAWASPNGVAASAAAGIEMASAATPWKRSPTRCVSRMYPAQHRAAPSA